MADIKLAIGVDSNPNGSFPGYALTSLLKHVNVAAEKFLIDGKKGTATGVIQDLRPEHEGVSFAVDEKGYSYARSQAGRRRGAKGIISSKIKVHDYIIDKKCPV